MTRHFTRIAPALAVLALALGAGGTATRAAAPNQAGTLDPSFGKGGEVLGGGVPGFEAYWVAIEPSGKILLAGWGHGFTLVRFTTFGKLDTSFGTGGVARIHLFRVRKFLPASVAIQRDGKIVVAGWRTLPPGKQVSRWYYGVDSFEVARYTKSGALDTSFGKGGAVTTGFTKRNIAYPSEDDAYAVAIQRDGKIVAAGKSKISTGEMAVARYTSRGPLDTHFGNRGKVRYHDPHAVGEDAKAVAIQPDGKILLAGHGDVTNAADFQLARFTPSGTLDRSFGTDGQVLTPFDASANSNAYADAIAVGRDDKIVVGGSQNFRTFALARYTPSGALDASFGVNGEVLTSFGADGDADITAIAVQPDGKIVVAGYNGRTFVLARYLGS